MNNKAIIKAQRYSEQNACSHGLSCCTHIPRSCYVILIFSSFLLHEDKHERVKMFTSTVGEEKSGYFQHRVQQKISKL